MPRAHVAAASFRLPRRRQTASMPQGRREGGTFSRAGQVRQLSRAAAVRRAGWRTHTTAEIGIDDFQATVAG